MSGYVAEVLITEVQTESRCGVGEGDDLQHKRLKVTWRKKYFTSVCNNKGRSQLAHQHK